MKNKFALILQHRFGLVICIFILIISISFLTRLVLLAYSWNQFDLNFGLLWTFFIGLFYDAIASCYYLIPFVLLFLFIRNRWATSPRFPFLLLGLLTLNFLFLIILATSEFLFWDEFTTRFNFIAVDYLVYTGEVTGNIWESYPVVWISLIWVLLSIGFILVIKSSLTKIICQPMPFKKRLKWAGLILGVPVVAFIFIDNSYHHRNTNAVYNELGGNGLYELFAAYRNNELDYDKFYKKINLKTAFEIVHDKLSTKDAQFISTNPREIIRKINHTEPETPMNVVLISVESFSASFMSAFGNKDNITPFLDALANKGILFTNLFATGTRTVRGLEALSLCIPPTPGQAIVRRPHNEHLRTLGSVFHEKGYETKFIYGGYSYFDNMGYFFENNDYMVVDRTSIDDKDIDYENIWGVADENLFELAISEMNKSYNNSKLFFAHVMTTSNHRPFTYPEGRIDIPPHTGRNGAVKYTDYAIGKFFKEAANRPWFNNTLFVVVADHCASSAGKTELPVEKYHIPMIIYSPTLSQPKKVDYLMSQIDVGPTVLGLLNFDYVSEFMGVDIFENDHSNDRVFISTYQLLGFLKENDLTILKPKQEASEFNVGKDLSLHSKPIGPEINEAIAWYQVASYKFKHRPSR